MEKRPFGVRSQERHLRTRRVMSWPQPQDDGICDHSCSLELERPRLMWSVMDMYERIAPTHGLIARSSKLCRRTKFCNSQSSQVLQYYVVRFRRGAELFVNGQAGAIRITPI